MNDSDLQKLKAALRPCMLAANGDPKAILTAAERAVPGVAVEDVFGAIGVIEAEAQAELAGIKREIARRDESSGRPRTRGGAA